MKRIMQIVFLSGLLVGFFVNAAYASTNSDKETVQKLHITSPISGIFGSLAGNKSYSGSVITMKGITIMEEAIVAVVAEESIVLSAPALLKEGSDVTLTVREEGERLAEAGKNIDNQWEDQTISLQKEICLEQNYPNPVKEITKISYYIPEDANTALIRMVDLQGNIVKVVFLTQKGNNEIYLDCTGLQPDVYMYSLIVDGETIDTKRMIVSQ